MSNRKKVSVRQLKLMIEFMEKHTDLALGRVRSTEGRAMSRKLWTVLAAKLNAAAIDKSGYRTSKDWNKFFNDYKCRIKNKIRKFAQTHQRSVGESTDSLPLSVLEKRLFAVIIPDKFDTLQYMQNSFNVGEDNDAFREQSSPTSESDVDTKGEPISVRLTEYKTEARNIEQPSTSRHSKNITSEGNDDQDNEVQATINALADMEKARLEVNRAQIQTQMERNIIEKNKVEAINNLANAAWSLVNIFKHNKKRNRKKSANSSSSSENDDV